MTEIQHGTFEAARSGRDVLGRARTGTGKTLAFLLPALESALRSGRVPGPHDEYRGRGEAVGGGGGDGGGRRKKGRAIAGVFDDDGILGDDERSTGSSAGTRAGIAILVLSPTRELAMQIHSQAQMLTSSHTNGVDRISNYPMISQVMYGGTSRISDIRKLEDNMPYVLIATPGRLIDHIRTSTVRGTSFAELIRGVSVWVLDEADRCLDMGFRNDMEYIPDHKPRGVGVMGGGGRGGGRTRGGDDVPAPAQTLLFSATLPKELRSIMASHMREDYLTVDCVRDVDPTTHTNTNVDQTYVTLPSPFGGNGGGGDDDAGRFISGLVDIIEDVVHVRNPTDYKIVVFFPTTAMCEFFSHVFNAVYRIPVLEIHSKKKQNNRTTTSDKFRKFDRGILFTTDVSARGVDYPNVTHVLQYGSAENRETYIHRLGRTGRAGKVGRGIIICVTPGEERQFVNRELGGLDVRLDDRYQRLLNGEVVIDEGETGGGGVNGFLKRREVNAARLRKILNGIGNGDDELLHRMGNGVYRSLLGYNMTKMSNLGLTRKEEVVAHVNSMAMQMGYREGRMPRMSPKIVQTLGLVGVRGVNVGRDSSDYEDDGVSGRGFDRGAGGSGSSRGRFGDRGRGGGGGQGRGRSRQLR
jgi:ATP-dependent RNA helicase MSS116